jgi:hypothetical protein
MDILRNERRTQRIRVEGFDHVTTAGARQLMSAFFFFFLFFSSFSGHFAAMPYTGIFASWP